jgi:hypothetical protein
MNKILKWLKQSNRYVHFLGGVCIGALANSFYCASYTGACVAASLELKDKMWGGSWDWIDFALTFAGAIVGQLASMAIWAI